MKIHSTAIVHPEARLDPSVEVGPMCTIGPHVKIGKGTRFVSHVVVDGWTEIGEDNTFFPFSVIGAVPQDLKYNGEPTQLIIGNRNTIREAVTLNLGTVGGGGKTQIGDDCLLMAYTHLGHDCIIGNHVIIANYGGFAGHVTVDDYANIGGMVGVSQFLRIGSYCYVAGCSAIDKDVPPFSVVIGSRPLNVKGANIVGMRRRGFENESITRVNDALKLWARTDVEKSQCLTEIETQHGQVKEVRQLLEFIRGSKAGVAR